MSDYVRRQLGPAARPATSRGWSGWTATASWCGSATGWPGWRSRARSPTAHDLAHLLHPVLCHRCTTDAQRRRRRLEKTPGRSLDQEALHVGADRGHQRLGLGADATGSTLRT